MLGSCPLHTYVPLTVYECWCVWGGAGGGYVCACVCVDARERGVYRKKERMRAGASERVSEYVCERERKGDKARKRKREWTHKDAQNVCVHAYYQARRSILQPESQVNVTKGAPLLRARICLHVIMKTGIDFHNCLQHNTRHCNLLQFAATYCNILHTSQ